MIVVDVTIGPDPLTIRVLSSLHTPMDPFTWDTAHTFARCILMEGFWSDRDETIRQYWPSHRIITVVIREVAETAPPGEPTP